MKSRIYFSSLSKTAQYFNAWDLLALSFVLCVIVLLASTAKQMTMPYQLGETIKVSLDPHNLPAYALRSTLRIIIAMFFSLVFTFSFGAWAAKSRLAEKILIPLFDILQSVPVLSFLSISLVSFIGLFPNSLLGPECASIFAIFTSQVWNMVFGFYQSLKSVPKNLIDAAHVLHLSSWQRFWRIEVPFAMPSLLWNSMVSLSASWFFVVASEAISIANQTIELPGIGSFIAVAIQQMNFTAVLQAIGTMLIVILIYDQVIFRPLLQWSTRFHSYHSDQDEYTGDAWVLRLLERTQFIRNLGTYLHSGLEKFINARLFAQKSLTALEEYHSSKPINLLIFLLGVVLCVVLFMFVHPLIHTIPTSETFYVFGLGLMTALRIFILILIACIIWVPIGVWIGLRPSASKIIQPIAQFLAAFPANLLFPMMVMLIINFHLSTEIWLSPLMILGSQWYILFNVIAGVTSLPNDLHQVARNFGIRGWMWWRRLLLPAIFPYLITGAITAAGGAWNASIVAEVVNWGNTRLEATGLGAYITNATVHGDFPRIALGTGVMCVLVLVLNRIIWQPLYQLAEERYQIK